jgi:hypothetical protein
LKNKKGHHNHHNIFGAIFKKIQKKKTGFKKNGPKNLATCFDENSKRGC